MRTFKIGGKWVPASSILIMHESYKGPLNIKYFSLKLLNGEELKVIDTAVVEQIKTHFGIPIEVTNQESIK